MRYTVMADLYVPATRELKEAEEKVEAHAGAPDEAKLKAAAEKARRYLEAIEPLFDRIEEETKKQLGTQMRAQLEAWRQERVVLARARRAGSPA
jgi:hypothetical protein